MGKSLSFFEDVELESTPEDDGEHAGYDTESVAGDTGNEFDFVSILHSLCTLINYVIVRS